MSFLGDVKICFGIICFVGILYIVFPWYQEVIVHRMLDQLERETIYIAELEKNLTVWSGRNNSELKIAKKIVETENKIALLRDTIKGHDLQWTLETTIPSERILGRDNDFSSTLTSIIDHMTVVLYSFKETRVCLQRRIDTIAAEYPNIRVLVLASAFSGISLGRNIEYIPYIQEEGRALEIMASDLTTEYFLYLSSGVGIASHNSNQSVSWLFDALEKIPELDFVGGSILRYESGLKYPVFEIPCYRLRMCNWTMSQSFEYRYFIDDMMVCEETSSSFMGRTSSLSKVGLFDSDLVTMATTDFFFRAKGKAIVGLRPEVMFNVSSTCASSILSATAEGDRKLPFMRKYQLHIIRDSYGREVESIDFTNLHYDFIPRRDNTFNSPFYNRGLLQTLELASNYLEAKNISYWIDAGVALGGIKMRGILPWDVDIDTLFFAKGEEVAEGLDDILKAKGYKGYTTRSETRSWNGKLKIWLYGLDTAYNTLFEEASSPADESWFMYIYIHGRRYPVKTNSFYIMRDWYGESFLEMHVGPSANSTCSKPGHHACLPQEFSQKGGHWRDFYCQL